MGISVLENNGFGDHANHLSFLSQSDRPLEKGAQPIGGRRYPFHDASGVDEKFPFP
jgi:hypothetical protein